MSRTCEISIWDEASKAVLVQGVTVRLPAEIGRVGPDGAGRISDADTTETLFGADLSTMSRQHMRITADDDGGVTVTDESSNGVERLVPGKPAMPMGRNRHEKMPPGTMRQFKTVGLIIEVALPRLSRLATPAQLFATYVSRSAGGERALGLAEGCIALVDIDGLIQIERMAAATIEHAMAKSDGKNHIAVLGPDGRGNTVVRPGKTDAVVCNRRALQAGAMQIIEHLDTIEAGPITLRILAEGAGDALVCVNPECEQMNAHEPGGNCRYCGTRLGDAVTRMLPSGGRT